MEGDETRKAKDIVDGSTREVCTNIQTLVSRPHFQDDLGKLAPERLNYSGF